MRDVDGLKKALSFGKKFKDIKGGNDFTFNFARCSDFSDDNFQFRMLPEHPEKAPNGFHLLSLHTIEITPTNKQRVLAQESWDPDYDPENNPSYIDRLLFLIQNNKEATYDRMSDSLRNVVNQLVPWRRFLYPIAAWVSQQNYTDSNGNRKVRYTPGSFSQNPSGIIWEVTAESLVERISELGEAYPDMSDLRKGRMLKFRKKGNKYRLDVDPEQTKFHDPTLLGDYPNLARMGLKQKFSDNQIATMCMESWWAPKFAELGIDLGFDEPKSAGSFADEPTSSGDNFAVDGSFFEDGEASGEDFAIF